MISSKQPLKRSMNVHKQNYKYFAVGLQFGPRCSADCAFDETVGVGLRSVYFGILSSILEPLVPFEVYRH